MAHPVPSTPPAAPFQRTLGDLRALVDHVDAQEVENSALKLRVAQLETILKVVTRRQPGHTLTWTGKEIERAITDPRNVGIYPLAIKLQP